MKNHRKKAESSGHAELVGIFKEATRIMDFADG